MKPRNPITAILLATGMSLAALFHGTLQLYSQDYQATVSDASDREFDFFDDPWDDEFLWEDEFPWENDDPEEIELPEEDEGPVDGEIPPGDNELPDEGNTDAPVLQVGTLPTSMPDALRNVFSKYINVFGVNVIATSGVSNTKVIHAATVMAEYLDNNEDGQPEDVTVVNKMVEQKATLLVMSNESESDNLDFDAIERAGYTALQGLFDDETRPGGSGPAGFDATLEEVLHLISSKGVALIYPEVFGEAPGSRLANAMDQARGGRFMSPPSAYPADSWYHYDDETCDYECMVTEYFYWALTSILGAQDYPGRAAEIANEWEASTRALVQSKDPDAYSLLVDAAYKLPTILPDGRYNPTPTGDTPGDGEVPEEGELPEEDVLPVPGEDPDEGEIPNEDEAPLEDPDASEEPDGGESPGDEDEEDSGKPQFHILPVGEPLKVGALAGAVQFANGWFYSPWFGIFSMDTDNPDPNWVYHMQLGWIYLSAKSTQDIWIWSEKLELGWVWTSRDYISVKDNDMGWSAANLYRGTDAAWLYYMPEENRTCSSHTGNLLYNYNTSQWYFLE